MAAQTPGGGGLRRLKTNRLLRRVYQNLILTGDNIRLVAEQPVIRAMLPQRVQEALDAGAGSGEYARNLLLPRAGRLLTVDIQDRSVRRFASRLTAEDRRVCLPTVGTITALPCRDRHFDLVLCCQVLEHVDDDNAVLAEFHRVLKDEGTLVMSVPVPPAPYHHEPHVREGYDRAEITEALERNGFEVQEHGYCLFRLSRFALKWRIRWARVPLPFMFLVHLERLLMSGADERAFPFSIVVRAVKRSGSAGG